MKRTGFLMFVRLRKWWRISVDVASPDEFSTNLFSFGCWGVAKDSDLGGQASDCVGEHGRLGEHGWVGEHGWLGGMSKLIGSSVWPLGFKGEFTVFSFGCIWGVSGHDNGKQALGGGNAIWGAGGISRLLVGTICAVGLSGKLYYEKFVRLMSVLTIYSQLFKVPPGDKIQHIQVASLVLSDLYWCLLWGAGSIRGSSEAAVTKEHK